MSIENESDYRSEEERIAAEQFNKEKSINSEMGDALLEQLSHFQRTETEQFQETNENLEKFVNKVNEQFSGDDQREIYDATMLMFTLHIYQKDRPEGSPYVSHPLAVSEKVISMSPNPDKELVIAALLHDSAEDQADKLASLSKDERQGLTDREKALAAIQNRYGGRVSNIVSRLSNPDFDAVLESQGMTKDNPQYTEAKNKLYAEHVAESIEDPDVLVIKLADFSENALKLSNLPTETEAQIAQKQKFIDKYVPVMKIFVDRLQRDNLFPEYQQKLMEEYNGLRGEISGQNT
jgi:(p)ppGpp synthase/HD superfamily hydrolase